MVQSKQKYLWWAASGTSVSFQHIGAPPSDAAHYKNPARLAILHFEGSDLAPHVCIA